MFTQFQHIGQSYGLGYDYPSEEGMYTYVKWRRR